MAGLKYVGWLLQTISVFIIARAVANPTNIMWLVIWLVIGVLVSAVGFYLSCLGLRLEFDKQLKKSREIGGG